MSDPDGAMRDADGAMGAGSSDAPDVAHKAGGDATGGGDPGNQDDMGADDGRTVAEGAGRILDGETPDADLRMDEPESSEANGRP